MDSSNPAEGVELDSMREPFVNICCALSTSAKPVIEVLQNFAAILFTFTSSNGQFGTCSCNRHIEDIAIERYESADINSLI